MINFRNQRFMAFAINAAERIFIGDTDEDNIINNVEPLWTKAPSQLKEEDYKSFYRTLYPMHDEPMFWIHLNVDYPFNLTGILYFPRIKSNIDLQRNKIQLYCNQVFVTDQVEGIVPEFLTLLHGVSTRQTFRLTSADLICRATET